MSPATGSRPTAPARLVALLLAAGVLLAAGLMLAPGAASASGPTAPSDDDAVRWSVTPADADGPDDRVAVEHTLDPGERVEDRFAVRNLGRETVTFRLAAADGFYTRTGRFDMLAADQPSTGAGTWVDLPEEVTVDAGETAVVDFTVTVPERVEPGDHAAGITASVLDVRSADDGTSIGVESRVGFRVLTRVTGEIAPAAAVTAVDGSFDLSWNAFRPGAATVTFDVVNEGNTRLLAQGVVDAGTGQSAFPGEEDSRQELLPGDVRTLTVPVQEVWPTFLVPVAVTLSPEAATMAGDAPAVEPVTVQARLWAVPWPQLAVVVGLGLLLVALLQGRRRSRRRIEAMLAEAREEGRRSAVPGEGDHAAVTADARTP